MRNDQNPGRGKIEIGMQGLGTVTIEMVDQRAQELAKMDGRKAFNETDLEQARAELQAADEAGSSPEVDERTEEIVTWDEPPTSSGTHAPTRPLDDEVDVGRQLVEEGLDEADHDQRLAAADGDRS